MSNPQYTEQQAQLLYDVLVHHSAATLAPTFDKAVARELNEALSALRTELATFIADSYSSEWENSESYDDDSHSQAWLDRY